MRINIYGYDFIEFIHTNDNKILAGENEDFPTQIDLIDLNTIHKMWRKTYLDIQCSVEYYT